MKTLTIKQPWASLIIAGLKPVENRTWLTKHRGPLRIHAGTGIDRSPRAKEFSKQLHDEYPGAVILGEVNLTEIVDDYDSEWAVDGMYHWVFTEVYRYTTPIPALGKLGLWNS